VLLPKSPAEQVLSGKYAETKDPRAELIKMTSNLTHQAARVDRNELEKSLVDAQRGGDRDRARLMAQLAVAQRRADHAEIARIKEVLAELARTQAMASETQGKQVD
jgi:hypothetical protein